MNKKQLMLFLVLGVGYMLTHVAGLTNLPVFADEAIYIRWSQLIIDDWQQYLFFPLNDGKTPLFMWLVVPFQYLFTDPLFAGRFVSVLAGFGQICVLFAIVRALGGKFSTALFAAILGTILPFWYFHHRMALIDGLLTFCISLAVLGVVLQVTEPFKKKSVMSFLLVSFGFGLALLTKLPAILFVPSLYLLLAIQKNITKEVLLKQAIWLSAALFCGGLLFVALKVHPAFGQLFRRGSEFLFPLHEVLEGKWKETIISIPNYVHYFATYLTPAFWVLIMLGFFTKKTQQKVHLLFWAGILFCAPIALMGRVVFPRYLFPATVFFTLSAAFAFEGVALAVRDTKKRFLVKAAYSLGFAVLLANIVTGSMTTMFAALSNPDTIPFVSTDRQQYLTEWSSGHGILEATRLIQETAKSKTVVVATEGSFGTLPDGILMYLHRKDVQNINVQGIGYPLHEIPESIRSRALVSDEAWLIVNSSRMTFTLPQEALKTEFCRPFNAECLQVWDISSLL